MPRAAIAFAAVKSNRKMTSHWRVTPSGVRIRDNVTKATTKLWITIRISQIDQPAPLLGLWDDFFFFVAMVLLPLIFFHLQIPELYLRNEYLGIHLPVKLP
jgi:hypothetical protein